MSATVEGGEKGMSPGGKVLFRDDEEWEEDLDSSIFVPKDDEEVWIPTFKQRTIAGFAIAILYLFVALLFWEASISASLIGGSVFFILTILFGERFVKFLCFILRYFGGPV